MKVRPLAFLLLATTSPLMAASVNERIDKLEAEVSEIQILLKQLNKKIISPVEKPYGTFTPIQGYQVRSGDSYWSIARRYKISISALERANPSVNPLKIPIGKLLNIPGRSSSSSHSPSTASHSTGKYVVRKGDILGRISEAHGIRLHQLMAANPGLNPRRLQIGKVLNVPGQAVAQIKEKESIAKVPVKKTPPKEPVEEKKNPYLTAREPEIRRVTQDFPPLQIDEPELIIVSKDSRLSEIAKRYQTTVSKLNELNDVELSPDQMIQAGSQLYVPGR